MLQIVHSDETVSALIVYVWKKRWKENME